MDVRIRLCGDPFADWLYCYPLKNKSNTGICTQCGGGGVMNLSGTVIPNIVIEVVLCILYFWLDKPVTHELCIELIKVKNEDPSMCKMTVNIE